jgi:hypothetical protein
VVRVSCGRFDGRKWLVGVLTIFLFGTPPACGFQSNKGKTMLQEIPVMVRDYLTAGDGLAQAAVQEKYPNVRQTLNAPETREAILRYLASDEPWKDPTPGFTINALGFLQGSASAKEVPSILKLQKHSNAWVRLRANEYMMAVYYPRHDRSSMVSLFQQMLMDTDEVVRVQAARWIKGVNVAPDMRGYLERWMKDAINRKWDTLESFEIIRESLK